MAAKFVTRMTYRPGVSWAWVRLAFSKSVVPWAELPTRLVSPTDEPSLFASRNTFMSPSLATVAHSILIVALALSTAGPLGTVKAWSLKHAGSGVSESAHGRASSGDGTPLKFTVGLGGPVAARPRACASGRVEGLMCQRKMPDGGTTIELLSASGTVTNEPSGLRRDVGVSKNLRTRRIAPGGARPIRNECL